MNKYTLTKYGWYILFWALLGIPVVHYMQSPGVHYIFWLLGCMIGIQIPRLVFGAHLAPRLFRRKK